MLLKKIIGAIRKLIGFGQVDDTETVKQQLLRDSAAALKAGDADGSAAAFRELLNLDFPQASPVRPTNDEVEVVKSDMHGAMNDPDYVDLTLLVKSTGHYVNLRMEHVAVEDWRYDLAGARLADKDGNEIRGKAGRLAADDHAVLERLYGHKKLENTAPAKNLG